MNIVFNSRLLIKNKLDGIGWYSFEILKRICQDHPEHQFYFLFDRKFSKEFVFSDNVSPIIIRPKARHPILWYLWFEISVARALKKVKADLFFSPDGLIPLKTKTKTISVIHDINFFHRPKDLPILTRKYYNFFFPKFANKANKIITVSEFTKGDIILNYQISDKKIDVVPNGCNEIYRPIELDAKTNTKEEYTSGKDYFIFIGSLHPRKNIERLFLAFNRFKKETKSDIKLVIVGQKFFLTKKIEDSYTISEYKNDIIFTGRITNEKLHLLLASSFSLVFVSLFEGFGIPILEAMNCDIPVICSNETSLPEVAGNAALYADPYSVESICNAMIKIVEDNEFRNDLIEKGRSRRQFFNWDVSADTIWHIIESELEK